MLYIAYTMSHPFCNIRYELSSFYNRKGLEDGQVCLVSCRRQVPNIVYLKNNSSYRKNIITYCLIILSLSMFYVVVNLPIAVDDSHKYGIKTNTGTRKITFEKYIMTSFLIRFYKRYPQY